MKKDLRKTADKYGGIPLFITLTLYFALRNKKTNFEYFLFASVIIALFIDTYLTFFEN